MLFHTFLFPSSITVIWTVMDISTHHKETFQCVLGLSLVTKHSDVGWYYFYKIIRTMYAMLRVWFAE